MEENNVNALEELVFIKKIIQDSKNSVFSGMPFIVWGVLVTIGLLSSYFAYHFHLNWISPWNWLAVVLIGWTYSIVERKYEKAKNQHITFSEKIVSAVWVSSGIAMTLFGFIVPVFRIYHPAFIGGFTSVVLGMAYYITATLFNSTWLKYISYAWWAGSILLFYVGGTESLLIQAGMMIVFQIVPGIVYYKKSRS